MALVAVVGAIAPIVALARVQDLLGRLPDGVPVEVLVAGVVGPVLHQTVADAELVAPAVRLGRVNVVEGLFAVGGFGPEV